MRRFISISMLLVMLLFAASPVLACVVPEPQMTADEQSCCAKMAGDCGDMAESNTADPAMPDSSMPDSTTGHSCCQKTVALVQSAVLTHRVSLTLPVGDAIAAAASLSCASPGSGFAPDWHLRINSPPPPLVPVSVTVLRI